MIMVNDGTIDPREEIIRICREIKTRLSNKENLDKLLNLANKVEKISNNQNILLSEAKNVCLEEILNKKVDSRYLASISNIVSSLYLFTTVLGYDLKTISKIVEIFPLIFGLSRENLEKRISWLQQTLGYNFETIAKIVEKFPLIFSPSRENLESKLKYLTDLRFSIDEIGSYIKENPGIISYSLKDRIIPRIEYLKLKGIIPESVSEIFRYLYPSDERLFGREIAEYLEFKRKIKNDIELYLSNKISYYEFENRVKKIYESIGSKMRYN